MFIDNLLTFSGIKTLFSSLEDMPSGSNAAGGTRLVKVSPSLLALWHPRRATEAA